MLDLPTQMEHGRREIAGNPGENRRISGNHNRHSPTSIRGVKLGCGETMKNQYREIRIWHLPGV